MANLTLEKLKKRIQVASKEKKADLVIKNANIVNVFTGEVLKKDIAICDGIIAGLGEYEGIIEEDAKGRHVIPGLIDGHMHIESTMLNPIELSKILLEHGVTTIMADPHEISNVAGSKGIEYMIKTSEEAAMDIFIMLPSCVPCTEFESNGGSLYSKDLYTFYSHPKVLGLGEFMDFPAIKNLNEDMLQKIIDTQNSGKIVDGHAAGLTKEELNVYACTGIYSDHECVNIKEAKERLELGMYLMIREGTSAKELKTLLPIINEKNSRRIIFVTDDKLLDDLVDEGSVDNNIRMAIGEGLDEVSAIQMATLNTAEFFDLKGYGAIAPGYHADLVILDDLKEFKINTVFKGGECLVRNGKFEGENKVNNELAKDIPSLNFENIEIDDLAIKTDGKCNIIEVIPNSLLTYHKVEEVNTKEGFFIPCVEKDQLKISVIERHSNTGNIGLGIVKGFKIKNGAIATTVSHDSHNIVVVGSNDEDMINAVNRLKDLNGGIVVSSNGKVVKEMPLEVGGLMSTKSSKEVLADLNALKEALNVIEFEGSFNPYLTLSFMTLPVIPELKMTDRGLFSFKEFSHIQVSV